MGQPSSVAKRVLDWLSPAFLEARPMYAASFRCGPTPAPVPCLLQQGKGLKLSVFIRDHMDELLAEWDAYAQTLGPAADAMSREALRDHCEAMLRDIAQDIDRPRSDRAQQRDSQGENDDEDGRSAASVHGKLRHASNFTLAQLSSEFRALRASVMRLWLPRVGALSEESLDGVVRFNAAIDQALAESIVTYSARAEQSRDMFVAILGHDLRGPLTSLSMAGEMLLQPELPAARAAAMGTTISRSTRYMTGMVNDMLEFARTRLGGDALTVSPEPTDLHEVCNAALALARSMHPHCTFEFEAGGPRRACIDADRVQQCLVNLLGNAGQHGAHERPIRLSLGGGEDHVELRVSNEGNCIPASSIQSIFEPLVRLPPGDDADQSSTSTSLGLGLHIAREIARAHGGTIGVESDDKLTTFTVRLPRESAG